MADCRTCKHNTYIDIKDCQWVCCSHPSTILKTPRWAEGDPAWVNLMTADIPVSRLSELGNCTTFEAAA